jgi:hypothetical protein
MTAELPAGLQLELRRIEDDQLIARLQADQIDEIPQPGRWLSVAEGSFLVLQRRPAGATPATACRRALVERPLGDR